MTKYAIYCKETITILEYIRAADPKLAQTIAKQLYPERNVVACYAEDFE